MDPSLLHIGYHDTGRLLPLLLPQAQPSAVCASGVLAVHTGLLIRRNATTPHCAEPMVGAGP